MGRIEQMFTTWMNRNVARCRRQLQAEIHAGKLDLPKLTEIAQDASLLARTSGALTGISNFHSANLATAARQIIDSWK